jgi:peroxiredoxin
MKTAVIIFALSWLTLASLAPFGNGAAQGPAVVAPSGATQERELDKGHLAQIFKAIQAYRRDHQNRLPDWLSDLFPKYLPDTSVLISAAELRTGTAGPGLVEDPKIHSSYNYEFSASPASRLISGEEAKKLTLKQWRTKQMKVFGTVTPLVRLIENDRALNLACSGDIYESQIVWETDPRVLALVKESRTKGQFRTELPPVSLPLLVCAVENDKPLAEAEVRAEVRTPEGWQAERVLVTDDHGTCRVDLPDRDLLELVVNVSRQGFLAKRYAFDEPAAVPSLLVSKLIKAVEVTGAVWNSKHEPIAGARVEILGLGTATTDADGRWSYPGVPQQFQRLALEISHPDYRPVELQASGTNVTAVLDRLLVIKGTVKDAVTGAMVDSFGVISGVAVGRGVAWNRSKVFRAREGRFNLSFGRELPNYLRVLAEGYSPADSAYFAPGEAELNMDFMLSKGIRLAARVVSPDNEPVFGAQVITLSESSRALLGQGRLQAQQPDVVRSDQLGRFIYASDSEDCALVAAATNGFTQIPLETLFASRIAVLQPWSRLEAEVLPSVATNLGKTLLFVAADPVLPQKYQGPNFNRVVLDLDSFLRTSPDEGNVFTFDYVPPGERMLWWAVRIDDKLEGDPENVCLVGTAFTAKPGETAKLTIGENTGTFSGTAHLAQPFPFNSLMGLLRFMRPGAPSVQERWLTLNHNGQFRIDDLPDAATNVELSILRPPVLLGTAKGLKIAPPASTSAPPVIEIEMIKTTSPGELAPQFTTRTPEGIALKLASYRGLPVLVEFWDSRCNPGFSSAPFLRTLATKYVQSGKLAIIGLNVDWNADEARRTIARLGMTWPQGLLGESTRTPLLAQFGVQSLPAAFLINAEGRLVKANIASQDILKEVERLLGGN